MDSGEKQAVFNTGFYDKANITYLLGKEVSREKRYKHIFSTLIIRFDNLDYIKDNFGKKFAEIIFLKCAQRIFNEVRNEDFIGRYSQDSILAFLPLNDKYRAYLFAERIRPSFENIAFRVSDKKVSITLSIGITDSKISKEKEELLEECDIALQKAISEGGNQTVIYENTN